MLLQSHDIDDQMIGGKAKNLAELSKLNLPVPKWCVLPGEVMKDQLETGLKESDLSVPSDILNEVKSIFGENAEALRFSVRSSGMVEDGTEFSFAGQFETFLNVPFLEIPEKITQVWLSTLSDHAKEYCRQHSIDDPLIMGVIIQEMIFPDVSGVAFGIDPVTNRIGSKLISSVYGLGEGIVSGRLNADTFRFDGQNWTSELVSKAEQMVQKEEGGIVPESVPPGIQELSTLSNEELDEISHLLNRLQDHYGKPQDIEFSYKDKKLYLLQTRPVTTLKSHEGEYTVWDNSNIIESYPGITTPLTFSFILKMYDFVYRQLVELMGVSKSVIEGNQKIFAETLGLVRGRVYYNLLNWYKMLALLPGYTLNAEFMENMMGVKERFQLENQYKMGRGQARWALLKMVIRMIILQLSLRRERKKFKKQLDKVLNQYYQIDFASKSDHEIIRLYKEFEESLLLKWKAPLVNDFFAMIWFGLLQKQTEKLLPDFPNIHNDLLCGSQDIISVQPIHRGLAIAGLIRKNPVQMKWFQEMEPSQIWENLNNEDSSELLNSITKYIIDFGERCVGELKLETISYSQDPLLFIRILKSYITHNVEIKSGGNLEENLRNEAYAKARKVLRGKPIKRWWFDFVLRSARDLVSNRENLRYERTRGFGMVRKMMVALGNIWQEKDLINHHRDIFYLQLEEILEHPSGGEENGFKELIQSRKEEFNEYNKQVPPMERFFTYGNDFSDDYIYSDKKIEKVKGDLKGIGCCPGLIEARVRLVSDPSEIESLEGDILVTTSTDPGWVTLFPSASGIIVERGSLLSHSAIVSREMGIPCIVGVSHLMRTLKTGDKVKMDGSTGAIQLI